MDYKSVLQTTPINDCKDYVEVAHSDNLDELDPHIRSLSTKSVIITADAKHLNRREDTFLNTLLYEHESLFQDVLNIVKERYFFDGLCTELTFKDVCDVFKHSTRIEYCDEDNSTVFSDDEHHFDQSL